MTTFEAHRVGGDENSLIETGYSYCVI